jgi:DNA-binding LacI/PurR family transcriptional regulator
MTVTLADVAARARVSPATVSRVLNGNYPVAASTRERVLRAVDDLDYVLNGPASSLAAATSDLVGILVNDIADPFFGIMAGAAQTEIGGPGDGSGRAGGEKLAVICNTGGSPERELTYLTLLQRQRAAAVILTGGAVEDPAHQAAMNAKLAKLADAGTRVVLCGRPPLPEGEAIVAALAFDNQGGGRRLTEHLLSLGHRRIGYVAGPLERTTTRHRLEGAPHRARTVRPPVRLRRDARTPAPRTGGDGHRRRQRHGGPGRERGDPGPRLPHPRGHLRGRLRRPAVLGGRGPGADDRTAAAVRGGGTGGPAGDGQGDTAARGHRDDHGGADGPGVDGAAAEVTRPGSAAGSGVRVLRAVGR